MRYLTERKRAEGTGSARTGTEHHWWMTISSYALIPLVILFVAIIGPLLGSDYETVTATLSRPVPAVIVGLAWVAALLHFKNGARMTVEDYWQGYTRQILLIVLAGLCWALIGFGLFALARIAL